MGVGAGYCFTLVVVERLVPPFTSSISNQANLINPTQPSTVLSPCTCTHVRLHAA